MKKNLTALILAVLILLSAAPAHAAVYTHTAADAASVPGAVYVAGNDDAYPLERYNPETERYEGVMPEVLALVSEETGMDFIYLRDDSASRADMVSAYILGSGADDVKDEIAVLSYVDAGETIDVGFGFTGSADAGLFEAVKSAVSGITPAEINGFLLNAPVPEQDPHQAVSLAACALGILLIGIIAQEHIKLRSVRRQSRINEMTDVETGIGNLAYFQHHFEHTITDHARRQYYVAYIMIDSDYLQAYHHESDFGAVVKHSANVLRSFTKHNETAARIAENGFAFAFHAAHRDYAELRMKTIISKLNSYVGDDEQQGKPVFHAAVYQLNDSDRSSELILMNLRRNCIRLSGSETQLEFCDADSMHSVQAEKENIESINRGFENEEFKLYLQFIVDNKSREITSAEALSRWENPEKGLLLPGKYIGILEATSLISRLDYYMFEMVCRQLEKWSGGSFNHLSLSCNFTRITISEKRFIDRIREISEKYSFDHKLLLIEITEDTIEKNRERAMRNMAECKKLGFRIALDDLGSGYTSLTNLCDYPIDVVKIDREIMMKASDTNGKKLFSGIIALAHSLHLKVVCEGVETPQQRDFAAETACDYVQGWFYSKPMPVEKGEDFIRQYAQDIALPE